MATRDNPPQQAPRRKGLGWYSLLLLPYLGLLYPGLYARATPALFGFPFFYWYQLAWVILASVLIGIVYLRTKD